MEIFVKICINIITYKKGLQKNVDTWPKAESSTSALGHTFASINTKKKYFFTLQSMMFVYQIKSTSSDHYLFHFVRQGNL